MTERPVTDIQVQWRIVPITPAHARDISTWTYEEPYSLYNSEPEGAEWLLDPLNNYFAVVDERAELVAFCCFGHDARVPGGTYDDEAIDCGTGMRPDLTGQGRGTRFFELVFNEARTRWPGHPLRTTIAAFNERSQRIVRKLGFQETEIFRNPSNREFVVFVSD
jgi:[ribosomal protein S18]-alanine N-acetyltransferase